MAILFFTNRILWQHKETMKAMVALMENEVKVLNIPQHKPDDHITNNSVVVSFGKIANALVNQYIQDKRLVNVYHAQLVHPEYLLPLKKNEEQRKLAAGVLIDIKEIVKEKRFHPSAVIIVEKDLPALEAKQLLLLKQLTEEEGERSCFQATKGGKLIEISIDHKEDSKADICLTFSEIFAIRSIMDILGVSEVDFVSANKSGHT